MSKVDVVLVLHTVPSGIFRQGSINIIGNGVVIDPVRIISVGPDREAVICR